MNSAELRDIASGLYYVARQSKNPSLAEDALRQLVSLRRKVSEMGHNTLAETIDKYIDECGDEAHAYDIADQLDESLSTSKICVLTMVVGLWLVMISAYVAAVNRSLTELR
jgi:hypothetical protein